MPAAVPARRGPYPRSVETEEPVGGEALRQAARQFPSGVTVAAAAHEGRSHAITATAFCSLSLTPPLVLLSVRSGSRLLELVRASGAFGISVLGAHQRHVGEWAATEGRPADRELARHVAATAVTGSPLVPGALAWFDCRLRGDSSHGDHTVLVGLVVATRATESQDPLLYFRGTYHDLGRASTLTPPGDL